MINRAISCFLILQLLLSVFAVSVCAEESPVYKLNTQKFRKEFVDELPVYKLNTKKFRQEKVLDKGTVINLELGSDVSSKEDNVSTQITFDSPIQFGDFLQVKGGVFTSNPGQRFSMHGSLKLGTGYLVLPDGQETYFFTRSTLFEAYHPPHASTNIERWGRLALRLSAGSSPATFGIGLGAAFVIGGLLSARKNGWKDFFWGGFDGAGLSVVESIARKQPDINIEKGQSVPFELTNDLIITRGLEKEKTSSLSLSEIELENKINFLLSYGDLAGAIELASRTGQEEQLNKLLNSASN